MNISVFRCRMQLRHRHNQLDGAQNFTVPKFNNHVEFAFFLVVRDNFKILYILYIQINFPAYKDYFCNNFEWFDSHAKKIWRKW